MNTQSSPPQGFLPFAHVSPFLESVGSFYWKGSGRELVLGVFVEERACNRRGAAHGGFLAGMADVALGYALATSGPDVPSMVTASLSIDYAGSAKLGDWLESHVDIQQLGKQLGFANVYLQVGARRIVRASGVFARPAGGAGPKPSMAGRTSD